MKLQLTLSWKKHLWLEMKKDYFQEIIEFLETEKKAWKIIYPQEQDIFSALNFTDFEDVKVVILWQDPYHWEGQAHWLSFSVQDWVKVPPSLKNVYREIENDITYPQHLTCKEGRLLDKQSWNLTIWAEQWVLLLNSCLTVEKSKPASHSKIWWQLFTDQIINTLSDEKENVVFLLWGAFAQSKKPLINEDKHLVLETTHPSPFSAYRWFLWSKHFSKTNQYLKKYWLREIEWIK